MEAPLMTRHRCLGHPAFKTDHVSRVWWVAWSLLAYQPRSLVLLHVLHVLQQSLLTSHIRRDVSKLTSSYNAFKLTWQVQCQ